VYTTAQQRENIEASLVELGIPGDQIFVDPDGTIVSRNPLLGNVPMAIADRTYVRFSTAQQREDLKAAMAAAGIKVYDGNMPDGEPGALVKYDENDQPEILAFYDPDVSTVRLPPSNHQQP
jgi:hypothetical protein